jgi:hypothetical protein
MYTTEIQLEFDFIKPEQMDLKINYSSDILLNTSLYVPPAYTVSFYKDRTKVGELDWNDGTMKFEGDAEESAQLFFDEVIKRYVQAQLDLKNDSGWKS